MPFVVRHRSQMPESLRKRLGEDIEIIDVTSKGPEPWIRFSPFYPHGDIPIPCSEETTSKSVEGLWQGLKVFESEDIDRTKFHNETMKKLKRTVRRFGRCLGHREGVNGEALLSYGEARWKLYLPAYRWVLDHCLQDEIEKLRELGEERTVVLLDYEKNERVNDLSRPLSHAGLLKKYLEDAWPTREG